jgi:YYY domain-containing protein
MEFGLVAVWILAVLLLGLLALPLASWLFVGLDSGPFAIPLAFAVLVLVGHLVGHVAFPWPALAVGLLAVAGGSAVALRRVDPEYGSYGEGAVVFVLAFLLVVLIRAFDPAAAPLPIAVGEKFLDFGLLQTLERSGTLPPEDFWFAGESVRYYYGGHLLTILLGTVTGTATRFSYNLALAGFYASLVTAAYGLTGSIVRPTDVPRRLAAGFGAFFVAVAANLATATKMLVWLLPDTVAGIVVDASGLPDDAMSWSPSDFYYFDASRVIPTDPGAADTFPAATEFPLFAWLNGDLHAHMMSQQFMLLAGGLLLAYWRLPAGSKKKRLIYIGGLLPPLAGVIGLTNLWSFPTVGGLAMLAVGLAPASPLSLFPAGVRDRLATSDPLGRETRRAGLAVAVAVAILLGGVVWTAPFWVGVVPGGPGRSPALWNARTPLGTLLLVHGAFLAVFAVALTRRVGAAVAEPRTVAAAFLASVAVATLVGFPALGIVAPLVLTCWWLARTQDDAGFELVFVVAGAGLVLLVEVFTIDGERFNTIFKPYSQVWLFWAIAAGALLARVVTGWPADRLSLDRRRLRHSGVVLAAVLVTATLVYPAIALPAHVGAPGQTVQTEGPTLDATSYLEVEFPREAAAIRWLDERDGRPTIVTAAPGTYTWNADDGEGASAPASLTGLPTVLGWFHEAQYRGSEAYEQRLSHVSAIYASGAENREHQRELLDFYGVEYVYVGPAERATYGEITVGDLPSVSVVREFDSVRIYAVDGG